MMTATHFREGDYVPTVLREVSVEGGRIQLLEWLWPDVLDFARRETELMLEMSLPPYSSDSSAEFPEIAPGDRCILGTLFIRYPGVLIHGRGEGKHSRVIRCIFFTPAASAIMGEELPTLETLQALLDIDDEPLRILLKLANRELLLEDENSTAAIAALMQITTIAITRLFGAKEKKRHPGRLAAWQHKKIRERLASGGPRATVRELANLCGVSDRHLQRQFVALTGETIGQYIDSFWIDRAKIALKTTRDPIKIVAKSCGFSHAASFSRAFFRIVGCTPLAFRQRKSSD
jgi:AraC-like DNA-binding protein